MEDRSISRHKLVIIGSGAAGWTAAIYAARAGLAPLVLSGKQHGGQMTIAGEIENFPGFAEAVDGPDLMERMEEQASGYGALSAFDTVVSVDFERYPFVLVGEDAIYEAESVIIATGATAKWLGVEGESRLMGKGVSACATCDGFFFKDKDVAVIGGGNTAVEEALQLSAICQNVHLIHRRGELTAERILQQRLSAKSNVTYHWNSTLEKIEGGEAVDSIRIREKGSGEEKTLFLDGVFVAIGHDPATNPFVGKINLDSDGYIATKGYGVKTNIPGVFAAGDVADPVYRQAVTAAGMGCMAALEAEKWLSGLV